MESVLIAIVFLDKDGFSLYAPSLESPMRFSFPKESVQDMEIINLDLFLAQVTTFLTSYTIPPSTITVIISQNLLFIHDIPTVVSDSDGNISSQVISDIEQRQKIQNFLDTVPFEVIESKTYPLDVGIRVVATNKSLYQNLISLFEKQGHIVKSVIPFFVLRVTDEGLNDEVITTVINNNEALKSDSFVIHEEVIVPLTQAEKKKQFLSLPKKQTKLYMYGGIFVVLLAVLGFMYKSMQDQNAASQYHPIVVKQPIQQNAVIILTPTQSTAAVPVGSIIARGSAINKTTITIQIQTNPNTVTQGQLIKNKLVEKGYTNIILNSNAPTTTAKTLLAFSTTVNSFTQQDVTEVISNIFTNFSTQQTSQTTYMITIIPSNTL